MIDINRHWYRSSYTWLTFILLPLSALYWIAVNARRLFYWLGIKKKYSFNAPVIIVGNITVGGTGKTPFVIWLANFLKEQGFRPGIVSRGYGGKEFSTAHRVDAMAGSREVGDEAVLLARRGNCPVMICSNRVKAVKALLAETDCNIVISDDGLQHYRLSRQLEIVMVDGERRFGNKHFLPAGPLRESRSRLKKVDFVITQQGALPQEYEMVLHGEEFISVSDARNKKPLREFTQTPVHVMAAIGNPQRFFFNLKNAGLNIIPHAFPDHYHYRQSDFNFGDDFPILMTEKDAVKCRAVADKRMWYMPVDVKIEKAFIDALLVKLTALAR